jgi:hypothetical protein
MREQLISTDLPIEIMQHKSLKEENLTGILVALYRRACQYNIPAVLPVINCGFPSPGSTGPLAGSFANIT